METKETIDLAQIYDKMTPQQKNDAEKVIVSTASQLVQKTMEKITLRAMVPSAYKNRSFDAIQAELCLREVASKEPGIRMKEELDRDDYLNLMPQALEDGLKLPRQFEHWLRGLGMKTSPSKRSRKWRGIEFWDNQRRYQIRPKGTDLMIEASVRKPMWMGWPTCTVATVHMEFTEKEFRRAITELRTLAAKKDAEVARRRKGPRDLRAWCTELGMVPECDASHQYLWNNRHWRLNCLGQWQVSKMLEEFDRWAISLEATICDEFLWNKKDFQEWCGCFRYLP